MKTALLLVVVSSFGSCILAQPSRLKHRHHEHDLVKREDVTVYTTIKSTVNQQRSPAPAAAPAIYVDSNGLIQSGDIVIKVAPEPAVVAPAQNHPPNAAAPPPPPNPQTPPKGSAAVERWGFAYAPFKADGNCKNADDIKKDFAQLSEEYGLVRIYGTSCNQVANVLAAAQQYNFKIFAGIFDITQVEQEADIIIAAAKNDWSRFVTISVGNELVNSVPDDQKGAMVDKVISAIGRARSILNGAGYKGKIVTVDTLVAAKAYPALCKASDYCAVNCHPFFDARQRAEEAGQFLTQQITILAGVIQNSQRIVITETGWPWKGVSNGEAEPSLNNQATAMASIRKAFQLNKSGVILFSIYNDGWKKDNQWTFGAERFWGIGGLDAPSG